eukprot:CAMPEP_0113965584 /NCGR_PEP_ID=MMETSP0011_2-20120614/7827_1 /TAXON_ID=101924 /ORGANISM="Rhodosorus marinus" /LENGTH=113 /DNA_ID=CAMNT_0000978115 /DNA_START=389 /DNA_END=730 /DNA_ORIENTATION=+ /assembly_acc=CAM_ASM_000156
MSSEHSEFFHRPYVPNSDGSIGAGARNGLVRDSFELPNGSSMAPQDTHPPALSVKHPNHSVVSSRYHMASIERFDAPDWPRIINLAPRDSLSTGRGPHPHGPIHTSASKLIVS